jgi:ribosomal protein S18 acetylase RimI-like enzyme
MIIRPAAETDLQPMALLTTDALSFASSPDVHRWAHERPEDLESALRALLPGAGTGTSLVVEVERKVVGFIACRFDELDPRSPDKRAVIELLAVARDQRGHGLGTHLVRELIATLPRQGATQVTVNVLSAYAAALTFWHRAGFRDSAVTMAVELDQPR